MQWSNVRRASLAMDVTAAGGLSMPALALAAAWFYTGGPRPYGYAGFGELFVFVFFGVVATVGSTYVHTGRVTGLSLAASVPIGLLATALLVVNNLRDILGDTAAGKRTLAVRLGDQRTRVLYTALMAVPFLLVPPIAAFGRIGAVVALVGIPFGRKPVLAVLEGARGPALIPVLGATGRVQLITGAALAAGIWLSP